MLELGAEVTYKMAIEAAKRFPDYQISVFAGGTGLGPFLCRDDMAFNHRILKAGIVTSVEPGIYVYGYGGFKHSDTVIVGKDKPEVTTKNTNKTDRASIT